MGNIITFLLCRDMGEFTYFNELVVEFERVRGEKHPVYLINSREI